MKNLHAGLSGVLMAAGALRQAGAAPVMHLCGMNPHVAAALRDWLRVAERSAAAPRQLSGVPYIVCTSARQCRFLL